MSDQFSFPYFYNYPPYFTLQPIKETQEKQKALWRELILKYCRHHKVYVICADTEDELPLFNNKEIARSLNREAKVTFLNDLAVRGKGMWLDKSQRYFLVLWKSIEEWADTIYTWARSSGMEDEVVTLPELSNGDETVGTEVHGLPREILLRALKVLEAKGKAKLFKGTSADDEGVKFF